MVDYYKKYKTTRVKKKIGELNFEQLATWVIFQRMYYKQNRLNDYRVNKLNEIDFEWNVGNSSKDYDNEQWFSHLVKLEDYKAKKGDCNVSQVDEEYSKLGKWLNDQRVLKKRNNLETTRLDMLEDLGVIWDMKVHNFEIRINELLEYKDIFGNFDVPVNYAKNKSLGHFIYRLKTKGMSTKWKKDKLIKIGFTGFKTQEKNADTWVTKRWYNSLNELKALKEKGIDINISRYYEPNPKLGSWVYGQKRAFKNDKLKEEQIKELKKIGFDLEFVNLKRKGWNDMFELVSMYKEEHGTCNVPYSYDKTLHGWVLRQRKAFNEKRIKPYRFDKLNSIEFEWKIKKEE